MVVILPAIYFIRKVDKIPSDRIIARNKEEFEND